MAPLSKPFIIFADARTGSTTLHKALKHRLNDLDLRMVSEPFNRTRGKFDQTRTGVRRFSRWLKKTGGGAKHLSAHLGFYANADLLRDEELKIVMLNRDNVLQQAVSWYIMEGATNWHSPDVARENARRLSSIEYPRLIKLIEGILGRQAVYGNMADKRSDVLICTYETLYSENALDEFNKVLGFLGLEEANADDPDVVSMSTGRRINTPDTYELIENINEVEEMFGGDRLGHLFDE